MNSIVFYQPVRTNWLLILLWCATLVQLSYLLLWALWVHKTLRTAKQNEQCKEMKFMKKEAADTFLDFVSCHTCALKVPQLLTRHDFDSDQGIEASKNLLIWEKHSMSYRLFTLAHSDPYRYLTFSFRLCLSFLSLFKNKYENKYAGLGNAGAWRDSSERTHWYWWQATKSKSSLTKCNKQAESQTLGTFWSSRFSFGRW